MRNLKLMLADNLAQQYIDSLKDLLTRLGYNALAHDLDARKFEKTIDFLMYDLDKKWKLVDFDTRIHYCDINIYRITQKMKDKLIQVKGKFKKHNQGKL